MNKLIEEVLTLAEVLELRCDPTGLAEGTVIESQVNHQFWKSGNILEGTITIVIQRSSSTVSFGADLLVGIRKAFLIYEKKIIKELKMRVVRVG